MKIAKKVAHSSWEQTMESRVITIHSQIATLNRWRSVIRARCIRFSTIIRTRSEHPKRIIKLPKRNSQNKNKIGGSFQRSTRKSWKSKKRGFRARNFEEVQYARLMSRS